MDIKITPRKLSGTVRAIASKSEAHRLLVCAALGNRVCEVRVAETNEDIEATARALTALGAKLAPAAGGGWFVTPVWMAQGGPLGADDDIDDHFGAGCAAGRGLAGTAPEAADGRAERGGAREAGREAEDAGPEIRRRPVVVDCGESGSTLRFLAPVAAALGVTAEFVGSGRLPERPMRILCDALRAHGCAVDGNLVPFTVSGVLRPGVFEVAGDVSSQYITGLLFALPLLGGDSEIRLTSPLESAGYVEMTLAALRAFGVSVAETECGWRAPGGQTYRAPLTVAAGGDWSNAAFWLTAFALGGCGAMTGLDPNAVQGDRAAAALLGRMGAAVRWDGGRLCVDGGLGGSETAQRALGGDGCVSDGGRACGAGSDSGGTGAAARADGSADALGYPAQRGIGAGDDGPAGPAPQEPGGPPRSGGSAPQARCGGACLDVALPPGEADGLLTLDMRDIPDLVPILAVAACGRRGRTALTGCGRLRLKESDRIASVRDMLRALGGRVAVVGDDILVDGTGSLAGGTVDARGDHRIAMAAAASSICENHVIIKGAQAVNKSYPAFFDDFRALGGTADVL